MIYKVKKLDGGYHIMGLADDDEPNTYLLYRYPDGDVDDPSDYEQMHKVLYDVFQWHDDLESGDRFETPFGDFIAEGVHVKPDESKRRRS